MPTLATEYNDTLAQAQLDALKSLHRMVKVEQDPARLCRMTAILMRAKPIEAEPPHDPNRDRRGRAAGGEADQSRKTNNEVRSGLHPLSPLTPASAPSADPLTTSTLTPSPLQRRPVPQAPAQSLLTSAGAPTQLSSVPFLLSSLRVTPRSMPSTRAADG